MSNQINMIIIEDEVLHIKLIQKAIRAIRDEFVVHTATNGREGLALIREIAATGERAMIILDLNMPIMTGFEVLDVLKDDPNLRHIPLIVLTTSDNPDDMAEVKGYGYNNFIVKPPNYDTVLALIEQVKAHA